MRNPLRKKPAMKIAYDVTIGGVRFLVFEPETGSYFGWTMTIGGKRVEVQSVDRLRDGGTTHIKTAKGTLTFPSKWRNPNAEPTWTPRD